MSLSDSINDKCWALADALRLGDFFDKHHLPPVLLPLAIVLLVMAFLWMTAAHGPPPCGDGMCSPGETYANCPLDCPKPANASAGITVTVEIADEVDDQLTVKLFDKDERQVGSSETGRKTTFEFTDVQPQKLGAMVICPNGKQQSARPKQVTADESTITLTLPADCFDYVQDVQDEPMVTYGSVFITVTDLETGDPVDATVSALRSTDGISEDTQYTEDGSCTLNPRADDFYYLTASATYYDSYNGQGERFYVLSGDSITKTIQLMPLATTAPGTVRVCAKSGSSPLSSGFISLEEVGGGEISSAAISNGCAVFSGVDAGKLVRAVLTSPPSGCVAPSPSNSMTVGASQNQIDLQVSCGQQVAYVKVIVHDQTGRVMTNDTTITLWNAVSRQQIPGGAPDSSLSMGTGGYTEEITVPANTLIQAKATAPPIKFIDTSSGPVAFSPNEHGSIDIVLGERDRGEFTFQGASIVYTPATPGSPVKVFVQQITFNGTVLTPQNSEVVVLIDGEEYDATYNNGA